MSPAARSSELWWVYILECVDGTYYTGITTNLEKRLKKHNLGKASKYTRCRLPVRYVWYSTEPDKSRALKRELEIKRMSRSAKIEMIGRESSDVMITRIELVEGCDD